MTAYYNEIDRFCCDWLSNLMDANLITPGKIDDRSIVDVRPDDLAGFERVHFFAGIGGWDHALDLAGWVGSVWTGSCPCQPFSVAGKRVGFDDARDLWPTWFNLIRQCRPPVCFGEQVASAAVWLDRVFADMEAEDFAVAAADLPAACVGAKHGRPRFWFVAHSQRDEQPWQEPCCWAPRRMGREQQSVSWDEPWQSALSRFRALGDGLPRSVGATDAARNSIVPQVAAAFIGAAMTMSSQQGNIP